MKEMKRKRETNSVFSKEGLEKGLFFLGLDRDADTRVSNLLELLLMEFELLFKLLRIGEIDFGGLIEFVLHTLIILAEFLEIRIEFVET